MFGNSTHRIANLVRFFLLIFSFHFSYRSQVEFGAEIVLPKISVITVLVITLVMLLMPIVSNVITPKT